MGRKRQLGRWTNTATHVFAQRRGIRMTFRYFIQSLENQRNYCLVFTLHMFIIDSSLLMILLK